MVLRNQPKTNNGKTEVPLEIIKFEILTKLPVRSLLRFKRVCKLWRSFLSTLEFTRMHLHKSGVHQKILLLDSVVAFRTLDCEEPNHLSTTVRSIPFKGSDRENMFFVGSLNGLICVAIRNTRKLMFWNPLTGACKKLFNYRRYDHDDSYLDTIGFYMDSSDDYRLLRVNCKRGESLVKAYIYSGRLNKWRKIEFLGNAHRISNYKWSPVTFSQGKKSLYFTASHRLDRRERLIIGFDVNSEKFREIQFPPVPSDAAIRKCTLVAVNDGIHLCTYSNTSIHQWKMEGEGQVWIKVASYNLSVASAWYRVKPIYIMKNGNWLIIDQQYDTSVHKTDMKTRDSDLLYAHYHRTTKHARYIETLVSPYN